MTKRCIPLILLRRSARLKETVNANFPTNACGEQTNNAKHTKSVGHNEDLKVAKVAKRKLTKTVSGDLPSVAIKTEHTQDFKQEIQNAQASPIFVASCDLGLKPDGFIEVEADDLDLERTLMGGQSFRWTKLGTPTSLDTDSNISIGPIFKGVVLNHVLQLWRPSKERIAFKRLNRESQKLEISDTKAMLEDYFHLKYKLSDLYREWSAKDEHLAACCLQYKGFRILRQDPVENVFSFICATNNNIKRISQMVDKLCTKYGSPLESGSDSIKSQDCPLYRSFPTVERLADDDVFQVLRYELGFGYRAKFITETAKKLLELSQLSDDHHSARDYLFSLRKLPYKETCKQLMQFQGIGRKVADCICLMSMDHLNSVPIDCHIYEIVCRHYMPNMRRERKTLTDAVHDLIGGYFNDLHGPLAGWSTSVLFVAELKHLKSSELEHKIDKSNVKRKLSKKSAGCDGKVKA